MKIFYNENDPKAAAWLRNLIQQNLLPDGIVDERSIRDINASELASYTQCHFFAGIGGWPYALRLAGWPDDVPVWTGSCPCQPLSSAGKRAGEMDERHLWPDFYRLIAECRPATVFGEQVASKDGLEWFDGISLDLEELRYAVGAASLPAACVSAPHSRHRIFWVADAEYDGLPAINKSRREKDERGMLEFEGCSDAVDGMGVSIGDDLGGNSRAALGTEEKGGCGWQSNGNSSDVFRSSSANDFWGQFAVASLTDGTYRRFEPGSFPLANGLPARVGLLRGYGNAIVPQVAQKFIGCYLAIRSKNEPKLQN